MRDAHGTEVERGAMGPDGTQGSPMEPNVPYLEWNPMGPNGTWGPKVEQCSRQLGGGRRPLVPSFQIPVTERPKKGPGRPKGTHCVPMSPHAYPARGVSL